jgi:hypothetical protein
VVMPAPSLGMPQPLPGQESEYSWVAGMGLGRASLPDRALANSGTVLGAPAVE